MLKYVNKLLLKFNKMYRDKFLNITGVFCLGSFLVGTGKLIGGILSHSFLTCMNAFYTYGVIASKIQLVYGISNAKSKREESIYYKKAGIILILASLAYMIYCIKLIYFPVLSTFDEYTGLLIATVTFTEIGINVYGIITERKKENILFQGLKWINFASSCICLVLTQTAILSFSDAVIDNLQSVSSNGILGVLMGLLATIVGIMMIRRSQCINKDLENIYDKDINREI